MKTVILNTKNLSSQQILNVLKEANLDTEFKHYPKGDIVAVRNVARIKVFIRKGSIIVKRQIRFGYWPILGVYVTIYAIINSAITYLRIGIIDDAVNSITSVSLCIIAFVVHLIKNSIHVKDARNLFNEIIKTLS